ncbi:ATP synthase complex subunit H-domain-containing protein [Crucibulum laeve]|uniref:ATP synthase complex subunit H-domain-containing protein n=1 Tax=Crucibulum laeve TaxID=68775 RepID=A0A5C3LY04_9AGAR|nr:ATP synthase complex subunit H-domain-containing protein [Crucibulum laeve]
MSSFLRQASTIARQASRSRAFGSSAVARKDLVQDIYVREIKSYKPPVQAKDAHVGVVKQYSLPPSPKAPALPSDLASELSAYKSSEPSVAAQAKPTEAAAAEPGAGGAEDFLNFLEQDIPKPEHHH